MRVQCASIEIIQMELVLRVNQLDACELDEDLTDILQHHFIEIFRPLQSIRINRFKPELKAFLRFLVWKYSLGSSSSTFGQRMLNLIYTSRDSHSLSAIQRGGLYTSIVVSEWLVDRCDWLVSLCPHPAAAQNIFAWILAVLKMLSLLNFLIFLIQGHYPTLKERLLGLKMVPGRPQHLQEISHSYLTREILWYGFSEFIFFILPHFNLFSIQNWMRRLSSSDRTADGACGFCGSRPTQPHISSCGHIYCYYCLSANMQNDFTFSCSLCNQPITSCTSASEVIS